MIYWVDGKRLLKLKYFEVKLEIFLFEFKKFHSGSAYRRTSRLTIHTIYWVDGKRLLKLKYFEDKLEIFLFEFKKFQFQEVLTVDPVD